MKSVRLSDLAKALDLEIVKKSRNFEEILINNNEVNRPGLQLSGYMEGFPYKRLQIIGKVEYEYYMGMPPELRYERFRGILSHDIPALIYANNREITSDILDLADYYNKTVMRSSRSSTRLISIIDDILEEMLSEEITMHAGLMEIYGMGVLITGRSSIGKSETALDLVIRGHRLVADDVVDVKRLENGLRGQCPENIRHFLEIRGIGILDIQRLYGVGAVKPFTYIDMVVHLEKWIDNKEYDRIGLDEMYTEILGVRIPQVVIPVKPGRNLAMIVEVATRNQRQKFLGYNAAVELNNRLIRNMSGNV